MISVIIPVYNADRFIEKAVNSASEQDGVSQIILIEDGSTDRSLAICKKINRNNSLVEFHRHPDGKNHGAGASRNLGILKSKGAYIAFLDADDYYLSDRFSYDIELLNRKTEIDGVYGALGVHFYDESERARVNSELTTVKYPIPPERLFEEMAPIGRNGYFHGDSLTVCASIFTKVGFFDESLELSQDTHMWIKMAAKASLLPGIIDKPVAVRGVHLGNRIRDNEKLLYYRPMLFRSLLRWANANDVSLCRRKILWEQLYVYEKALVNRGSDRSLGNKFATFSLLIKHFLRNPKYRFSQQNILTL